MINRIAGSYYGHYDTIKKPKRKLYKMAIEEYIARSIKKETNRFSNEISRVIESFKKENDKSLKRIEEKIKEDNVVLANFKNFFYEFIEINKLSVPIIKEHKKSNKKNKQIKSIEEDQNDGYL